MSNHGNGEPTEALRLYVSFRRNAPPGLELQLEDIDRLEKIIESSYEPPILDPEQQYSGFWYELHDEQGEVLYRKIEQNPMRNWIDLPNEEDPSRIEHYVSLPDEKLFVLLVPYYENGRTVVLYSSPLEQFDDSDPAEPRWRIDLP